MGLEMLGAVGEAEVQQAVCLAAQSLAALGAEWVLEVSHMGYLFGLFDALGVPEAARAQLLEKLRQKNAHELRAAALSAGLSKQRQMPCAGCWNFPAATLLPFPRRRRSAATPP